MSRESWARDGEALHAPGEHVLLLAVDLPIASHRGRIAALPFAIEDRIAEPLDAVHVAIGPEIAPRRYIAAVVKHERMREWTARAEAEGLGHLPLVPEPLALPVPPEGEWFVDARGERAIVRTGDGAGFATSTALLPFMWEAGGKPGCVALGEPLPGIASVERGADPRPSLSMDLRQGPYAHHAKIPALWRRAAIVAGAGLAAHGVIAAADTIALRSIAAERRAETRALVSAVAPAAGASEDVAGAVADMLPAGGTRPGPFLPALARASAALAPLSPAVSLRALSFDGALKLELEAVDPAALENARGALARAGLPARIDGVVAQNGKARGIILLQRPPA